MARMADLISFLSRNGDLIEGSGIQEEFGCLLSQLITPSFMWPLLLIDSQDGFHFKMAGRTSVFALQHGLARGNVRLDTFCSFLDEIFLQSMVNESFLRVDYRPLQLEPCKPLRAM